MTWLLNLSLIGLRSKGISLSKVLIESLSLEDIGYRQREGSVDDVLDRNRTHCMLSGTKVNLDHILNDLLDEEYQEEIFDYFRETEEDSIDDAIQEFDGTYSEEELRMMRIKFLSIMGN